MKIPLELHIIDDGDENIYLNFWDSLSGDDRIWALRPDGTAIRMNVHTGALSPVVDMVSELRELAKEQANGRPTEAD